MTTTSKTVRHILQWWNLAHLYITYRRSEKHMNHVKNPFNSADIRIFLPEISNFCYIKKYRYRLQSDTSFIIPLTFFECLKVLLEKLIATLMMSAKLATIGLVKNKHFETKVMTSLLLSLSSPTKFCHKFFRSNHGFYQKNQFFWGVLLVQF